MTASSPTSRARAITGRLAGRPASAARSRPAAGSRHVGSQSLAARTVGNRLAALPTPNALLCLLLGVLAGLGAGAASSPALGVAIGVAATTVAHAAAGLARRRRTAGRRLSVRKALRLLCAELVAGSPPDVALDAASAAAGGFASDLRAAAGAARDGDDVGVVLVGDAEELAPLGAAFTVCARSGAGIAAVLGRVEADVRAADDRARAVSVALAGPRSSSVLLALLPAVGLVLGAGMGTDPLSVLLGSPAGQLLLAAGIVLDALGLAWTMRVTASAERITASVGPRRQRRTAPAVVAGRRDLAKLPMWWIGRRHGSPRRQRAARHRLSGTSRRIRLRPGSSPTTSAPSRRLQLCGAAATGACALLTLGPLYGLATSAVAVPIVVLTVKRVHQPSFPAELRHAVPLALDLIATVLRAGQPISSALAVVASAVPSALADMFRRVADQLVRGVAPEQAWRHLAGQPVLGEVAQTACRSAESGIRLAAGFEALAAELRTQARADAETRAHRAGVLAIVPLGICFLPAFVCVGVLPVVIGVARGALGGLQ